MPTVTEVATRAMGRGEVPPLSRSGSQLLTVSEVAGLLRLSVKGIYVLVETRRIPVVKVGNRLRFFRGEIEAWLEENRLPLRRTP